MFAATSPSDLGAVRGAAEVRFHHADGATRLAHLYHHDPLRVLFPQSTEPGVPVAVLANTGGGLVGGDDLRIEIAVADAARALVTGQSAEKIYRSAGADGRIDVSLSVGAGGWLEYLPHETIVFEGARLRRRTAIDAAAGGKIMAAEMLVFGRAARGERLSAGLVRDAWEVRRDGRLIWADALHMAGDLGAILADPFAFDAATAMATVLYVGDDAAERLASARDLLAAQSHAVRVGATLVNGVLVARWLGGDAAALRIGLGEFWAAFRQRVGGLTARLPRLWHI